MRYHPPTICYLRTKQTVRLITVCERVTDTRSGSNTGKDYSCFTLHCVTYAKSSQTHFKDRLKPLLRNQCKKLFEHVTHQVWGHSGWWGAWFHWGSAGRWRSAWQWSVPPSLTSACFASGRSPGRCLHRTPGQYRTYRDGSTQESS